MNEIVFKLFSDCIPVRGSRRSVIYDLGRNDYKYIPNILYEILSIYNGSSIQVVKDNYKGNENYIDEYFKFLEENEFIFYCSKAEVYQFPPLDLSWDYPAIISTAIINIYQENKIDLNKIINELSLLGCKDFLFNFNRDISFIELQTLLEFLSNYSIKSVDFNFPYSAEIDNIDKLTNLCDNNIIINKFIIYKSPIDDHFTSKSGIRGNIFYTKQQEINFNNISDNNFVVNIPFFTEAQKHNVFFNRKVIISSLGFITNSILNSNKKWILDKTKSIESIINEKEYMENWFINKDSIVVCKDCEYRYMCVDSRDPLKACDGLHSFSPEFECPYNPYVAKWKGQEGWVSVKQYYNNQVSNASL